MKDEDIEEFDWAPVEVEISESELLDIMRWHEKEQTEIRDAVDTPLVRNFLGDMGVNADNVIGMFDKEITATKNHRKKLERRKGK